MYVFGKNVAKDIEKIEKAYVVNNFKDKDLLKKLNCPIVYVEKEKLDRMVDGVHQGIVLKVADYDYCDITELDSDVIVILDHLEDPHNFGAIIRTSEAMGIKHIIIPKDRSVCVNETVMKTSAGALNHVNIIQVTNLVNAINYLKAQGFFIYGAEANGVNYKSVDYSEKRCLVIGSEGKGISPVVRKNCDEIISLPMKGHVNSLNASVAAGILIYGLGD